MMYVGGFLVDIKYIVVFSKSFFEILTVSNFEF